MYDYNKSMGSRAKKLYDILIKKARGDRSEEWFKPSMFEKFMEKDGQIEQETVLIRRAKGIDIMLKALTDKECSKTTYTAEIHEGDLLLGNLPMGSNGLGKVFPQVLTEEELRAASITNRNSGSLFGHNSVNYSHLLNKGLLAVIEECHSKQTIVEDSITDIKLKESKDNRMKGEQDREEQQNIFMEEIHQLTVQKDFYKSVEMSCQAVIDYAARFSVIAEENAAKYPEKDERRAELLEMAQIAKKVPAYPAETFHEAMQSITFYHIALHSSMNFMSLGRLDQVLQSYYEKESDKSKAYEIVECFLIKLAWRLNLTSEFLIPQDHVDYSTALGTHPTYIDQKAGVNNFLQNIILSGKTPDGKDATNDCTYLILNAIMNVNLSAPGVYVRLSKESPKELREFVAMVLNTTRNNPAICNDDVMIPAFYRALMQDNMDEFEKKTEKDIEMWKLANDYCVDGCWEPILNGKSDWTFGMINIMNSLEAAMNKGATVIPYGNLFRGAKIAPAINTPKNFDELMDNVKKQTQFFVDQSVMSIFIYYMIDEYACPSPLVSAFLEGCMEKGRDKSWGGANYNLGGLIFGGVPNLVNTLMAIRKWVFPKDGKGKYEFNDVLNAFRYNFVCVQNLDVNKLYLDIENDFNNNTPKFGNGDADADEITNLVLDICYGASMESAKFAKMVFQNEVEEGQRERIKALRSLAGYYGLALQRKFKDFEMKVTVGMGTFEQYHWQGLGSAASADRHTGDPLAPNFSPVPGTNTEGFVGITNSFDKFNLQRFAGGVITDICFDDHNGNIKMDEILNKALDKNLAMFTLTIASLDKYKEIYNAAKDASENKNKEKMEEVLKKYADVNVRIGGWQTPFVTLPLVHMLNYINRAI